MKKPIIYCDYCQHDLKTQGLICHDSQTQTNFYGNYFIMVNGRKVNYQKNGQTKKSLNAN